MSKILFNMTQINQLEENPNVASASERSIQYTAEFKVKAVHGGERNPRVPNQP